MLSIDSHQHFWRYRPDEFSWISDDMAELRRDFLPENLAEELDKVSVAASVAVQARQSIMETDMLLDLAACDERIAGVVGWLPLADEKIESILDEYDSHSGLKGVRHVIQDEPDDDFISRHDFNRGVSLLNKRGLAYDILIFERHLPQTIDFVDRHPEQRFILDHVAKPRIKDGEIEPWASLVKELSRRENVFCKLSGMVTEADWRGWTEEDLLPYVETVLEAFGPKRLMFGSDWPVCVVAGGYARWIEFVERFVSRLSETEQAEIMGGAALRAYEISFPEK